MAVEDEPQRRHASKNLQWSAEPQINVRAENMARTYPSVHPRRGLMSFADTGSAPFGQPPSAQPTIRGAVPTLHAGPQPVYHLKVTATPVKTMEGEHPTYKVLAGPTTIGEYETERMGAGESVVAHVRPEEVAAIEAARQSEALSQGATRTIRTAGGTTLPLKTISIMPEGSTLVDPATGKLVTVKSPIAPEVAKEDNRPGRAQVHAYPGEEAVHPTSIWNRTLRPVPYKGEQALMAEYERQREEKMAGRRGIPKTRLTKEEFDAMEKKNMQRMLGQGGGWCPSLSTCCAGKPLTPEEMEKQALETPGRTGESSDTDSMMETQFGYSRLIPELMQGEDDNREQTYNWVMPALDLKEHERTKFGLDIDTAPPQGAMAKLFGRLFGKGEPPSEVSDINAAAFAQMFQTSDELNKFLGTQKSGLVWEADEEVEEGAEIKPSILYGGVEHCPPEYAGRNRPMSYKLHAVEFHQYVPVQKSEAAPPFKESGLDPNQQAIFGPVPLPFDPANSGMIAPCFTNLFKGTQREPTPMIAPLVRAMYPPELPVQFQRPAEFMDGLDQESMQESLPGEKEGGSSSSSTPGSSSGASNVNDPFERRVKRRAKDAVRRPDQQPVGASSSSGGESR